METQIKQNNVTITQKEAQEYCAYKRQKKISEIMAAMRRSGSLLTENDSVPRLAERATRLKQACVRMQPTDILRRGEPFLKSALKIDCIVGGSGETFLSVKAYEAKKAVKAGAKEITLLLTPSAIAGCRYQELRKELKKLRRVTKGVILKARVSKAYPQATMARLVRLCAELRIDYFSLPYYEGCQHLQTEPLGRCLLEVSEVDNLVDFKKMAGAGVGRILTSHAWEVYSEWLKEVEEIKLETPAVEEKKPSAQVVEKPERSSMEKTLLSRVESGSLPALLPPPAQTAKP